MESTVVCIGAAHIDRKAMTAGPVTLGSSNPVSMKVSVGGVARNVADNLARLGLAVALVSRVGTDMEGVAVLSSLAETGIDTTACTRSTTATTASYTALLDRRGDLVVGLADMDIYDELSVDYLEPLLPRLSSIPVWFIDCNLPAESLRFLLRNKPKGCTVYVDCVSVAKAMRLEGTLRGIDTLFANADEAAYLSHVPIKAPLDVCEAGYRLMCSGVGNVVITRGSEGAFVASPYNHDFFEAYPADVAEVTGAGDALIAGVIFGRLGGHPMDEAMQLGMACSAWALEATETVNPVLNAALVIERAGLLRESA